MTACIELYRKPGWPFSHVRDDDLVPCLKASGAPLWLLGLGEGPRPKLNRLLRTGERCVLQGLPPKPLEKLLSAQELRQAVGNAMAVPVVGSAVLAVLLSAADDDVPHRSKRPRVALPSSTPESSSASCSGSTSSSSEV